jgi:hypothetical protein
VTLVTIKRYKLIGGKKPARAEIELGQPLGAPGNEGTVFDAKIKLNGKFGEKSINATAKVFHPGVGWTYAPPEPRLNKAFQNPKLQFQTTNKLIQLNKTKKLGLRLPTLFRLTVRNKKPIIISTKREQAHLYYLTKSEEVEYKKDMLRQMQIARSNGYLLYLDAFMITREKSGKIIATITDAGGIEEMASISNKLMFDYHDGFMLNLEQKIKDATGKN